MRTSFAVVGLAVLWGLGAFAALPAQVLMRISEEEFTHQVAEAGGQLWLATDNGAYRVEGDSLTQVLKGVLVKTIVEVDGRVWLGSARGVFRVEGDGATAILKEGIGERAVNVIRSVGSDVWVGTQRGLIRVEGEAAASPPVLPESINAISEIDGQLWIGTSRNAYRLDHSGSPTPLFGSPRPVTKIVKAGSYVWLITNRDYGRYGPCFRLEGDQPREVPRADEVVSVAEVEGQAWLATTRGVFSLVGGSPQPVPVEGLAEPVNTISVVGDQLWLGSTKRAYRRLGDVFVPTPEAARGLNVKGIVAAAGQVWVWGESGAFRFDEDVKLRVRLRTHSLFGLGVLLAPVVGIEEVGYARGLEDAYAGSFGGGFEAILAADRETLDREVAAANFIPAKSLEATVPYGFRDLHLMVRDAYGNAIRPTPHTVLVLPGPVVGVVLAALGWWVLALAILAAAPWSRALMKLLMARRLRRQGSLWAIPLALRFARVRRHLLRRYVRQMLSSEEFSGSEDDCGQPPTGTDLGRQLAEYGGVLLVGDHRLSERFLRVLARKLAAGRLAGQLFRRRVPIFLPLDCCAGIPDGIRDGAVAQLTTFGELTDEELTRTFLRLGGFIFLLDGLGRLEDEGLLAVERFVAGYGDQNFTVVGSDSGRTSFQGFPPVRLSPPQRS